MTQPGKPEPSDQVLVAAARRGETAAFEALLDRYQVRVFRVLRLMGVPSQDREDVAQEVFLRVFRSLGRFRLGGSFPGWLYRTAVNAAHDYRIRAGRRRFEAPAWEEGEEAVPAVAAGGTSSDPAPALELREALERALERLTDRERAVFILCEVEGLETRQAGRALGITAITVRRHLGLARRRLREILDDHAP